MSYLSKVVLLFHHSIIFSISDNITVTCRASTLQWRSPNLLGTVEPTLNMRPVPNLSPLPMTWPSPVSVSLKSVSFRNCCIAGPLPGAVVLLWCCCSAVGREKWWCFVATSFINCCCEAAVEVIDCQTQSHTAHQSHRCTQGLEVSSNTNAPRDCS